VQGFLQRRGLADGRGNGLHHVGHGGTPTLDLGADLALDRQRFLLCPELVLDSRVEPLAPLGFEGPQDADHKEGNANRRQGAEKLQHQEPRRSRGSQNAENGDRQQSRQDHLQTDDDGRAQAVQGNAVQLDLVEDTALDEKGKGGHCETRRIDQVPRPGLDYGDRLSMGG